MTVYDGADIPAVKQEVDDDCESNTDKFPGRTVKSGRKKKRDKVWIKAER